MSGCFDRVRCQCDCLEPVKEWLQPKRNMFASIVAGTLVSPLQIWSKTLSKSNTFLQIYYVTHAQFAVGWWVVIDACAEYAEPKTAAYHICGLVSTIALFM